VLQAFAVHCHESSIVLAVSWVQSSYYSRGKQEALYISKVVEDSSSKATATQINANARQYPEPPDFKFHDYLLQCLPPRVLINERRQADEKKSKRGRTQRVAEMPQNKIDKMTKDMETNFKIDWRKCLA